MYYLAICVLKIMVRDNRGFRDLKNLVIDINQSTFIICENGSSICNKY